ncbi:MAG: hypothetical protein HDR21_12820 [Lachnospiraceae bacterium]|nr:hypothetical protein [Lachnospiraceae bacterium]
MDEKTVDCLEQFKEMLAQEYTISHHSICNDPDIKNRFISAVKQSDRLDEFTGTIEILLEINRLVRENGFLYITNLKNAFQNRIFGQMVKLLEKQTNLLRITALLEPAFYYMEGSELIESVLIHDGIQMCVLGYTEDEMRLRLNHMIGRGDS